MRAEKQAIYMLYCIMLELDSTLNYVSVHSDVQVDVMIDADLYKRTLRNTAPAASRSNQTSVLVKDVLRLRMTYLGHFLL